MAHLIAEWPPENARLFMRRINAIIYVSLSLTANPGLAWTDWRDLPVGLRGPGWTQYVMLGAVPLSTVVPVGYIELSYGFQVSMSDQSEPAGAYYTYTSEDVWLDALPGVPGIA